MTVLAKSTLKSFIYIYIYIYISNDSCHIIRIFISGYVWQHVKYFQVKILLGKENIFKCLAVL